MDPRAQTLAYRHVEFFCPMHISVDCIFQVCTSIMVVMTHENKNDVDGDGLRCTNGCGIVGGNDNWTSSEAFGIVE